MAKFRKKPVVIDAAYYDGNLVGDVIANGKVIKGSCPGWFPGLVREVSAEPASGELRENEVCRCGSFLYIGTLEGIHCANPGDWIIRGVAGEIYPCKPEIFAATYDAA
ncbi:hypothetical protein KX928_23245 [Roseobacter sp. YSTF-M11]|uniref:Uncharacterized protein n=1 Tax=Roseobacter insulae TaxID=2859783 RepID=A0A9X1K0M3_9RHOB|nr:hypothetical protein [Roseobacter insulae]MBW4710716.1 hypothetical protein [Roseobacter insulae]